MAKVDCEDCFEKFNTKKLYITHVKSKTCSKAKSRKASKVHTLTDSSYSDQEQKKARLEELQTDFRTSDPRNMVTPTRLVELQGQIKNLTEDQKRALQDQITRKQRQVLQTIPYNQLSAKQKDILKNLSTGKLPQISSALLSSCTPSPISPHMTTARTTLSPATKLFTQKSGQLLSPKPSLPSVKKTNIQIVRRVPMRTPTLDVIKIPENYVFSDESIAAEVQPTDSWQEDLAEVVDGDQSENPKVGSLKIRSFARSMLNIQNMIVVMERSVTPTNKTQATVKVNCPKCKKIFSKTSIEAHIESKHKIDCAKCKKRFLSEDMKSHMKSEHELPREACNVCGKVVYKQVLAQHVDIFHKAECRVCLAKYFITELQEHIRNVHETEACDDCSARFAAKGALDRHIHSTHLVETCQECEDRFKTVEDLDRHVDDSHPKEYCDEDGCDSWFKTKNLLSVHKDKKHPNPNKFLTFGGGMFMMMMVPDDQGKDPIEDDCDDEDTEEVEDASTFVREIVIDLMENLELSQKCEVSLKDKESRDICIAMIEHVLDDLDLSEAAIDNVPFDHSIIGEDMVDEYATEDFWL